MRTGIKIWWEAVKYAGLLTIGCDSLKLNTSRTFTADNIDAFDNFPHTRRLQSWHSTEKCNFLFSFRFMEFECSATKSIGKIQNASGVLICPYLYPHLQVLVNQHIQTTRLFDVNDNSNFFFGTLELPKGIAVQNILASIRLYFQSDFDILVNLNKSLDENLHASASEADSLLLKWEGDFGRGGALQQRGDLTCLPSAGVTAVPAGAGSAPCPWDGYTPGFWDTRAHAFLPVTCAYPKRSWPPPAGERGPVWVHLVGDSNMNIFYSHLCGRIGYRTKYRGERFPGNVIWSACFNAGGSVGVVHTVSWMGSKAQRAVCLQLRPPTVGQTLASFLCSPSTIPQAPAAECTGKWNATAEWTLVLPGSHNPELLIPRAAKEAHAWLDEISGRMPQPETLVVALTGGVCMRHMALRLGSRSQILQRNNYRMRAANDAVLFVARERGLPVLDFFSVTLAAGCGAESKDAVHFQAPVYSAETLAFLGWISAARNLSA